MSKITTIVAAFCLAVLPQCAMGQFVYQADVRGISTSIERYWLLNGFPTSKDLEFDDSRPEPDFSDFDEAIGVAIEVDPESFFRCDASLDSQLTPTSISGTGSVWAEEGPGTPLCDDEYFSVISGYSRIYVDFVIENDSLVDLRAEQTLLEGEGQVGIQLGVVDEAPFEETTLSATTVDRRDAVFRLSPGAYRFVVWNTLDLFCEQGVAERSDFDAELLLLGTPCNPADLAAPVGVLDLGDIQAFVEAFTSEEMLADLAEPVGVFDLGDLQVFVTAFLDGCP